MSILFFIIAVIFYTISQAAIHGKIKGKFWDKDSYKNKYDYPVDGIEPAPQNWYYKLFKIKYKERFPGSATIFVTLTDGYHLTQFGFKAFICSSIAFYNPVLGYWDALGYFVLFGVVFTVLYRII